MGVRNKYCLVCTRASNSNITPTKHVCFKNWDDSKSSSSMEASIIVEGFKLSENMYGVRYARFIGDGDSNVYKKILEQRPYKDLTVQKVECRNHLYRNFCNKLRDVTKNRRYFGEHRNSLSRNIFRLRNAIAKAVKFRKISNDLSGLRGDIENAPYHVFGSHGKCDSYYCQGPKENEVNKVPGMEANGIFGEILTIVRRLLVQTKSLIQDLDSNIVESYNAVVAKCISGESYSFFKCNFFYNKCR